jgi:hypothetical protein
MSFERNSGTEAESRSGLLMFEKKEQKENKVVEIAPPRKSVDVETVTSITDTT